MELAMIFTKMTLVVCALTLYLSGTVSAQQNISSEPSVRSIYDDCMGKNVEFCNGFLLGVARSLEMLRVYDRKFAEEYCPPAIADLSSYRDIFVSWADHSKFWKAKSYDGVVVAFWIEWFCPNIE